ncbi:hypothetical protein ACLMJK_000450 [Lecanora helva]
MASYAYPYNTSRPVYSQQQYPYYTNPNSTLQPPSFYPGSTSMSRNSSDSSYDARSPSTAASSPPSLQEYPPSSPYPSYASYPPQQQIIEVQYTAPASSSKQKPSSRTKSTSSSSATPNGPPPGYTCLYPGCPHVSTRSFDLERHMKKHYPIPAEDKFDCPGRGCGRTGEHGFDRKDHMIEHLRNYHMQDIPKGKGTKGRSGGGEKRGERR